MHKLRNPQKRYKSIVQHGCTGHWMGWSHGHYHGLDMDALADGWAGSMDVEWCRPERRRKLEGDGA